jgi:hypothetical protein
VLAYSSHICAPTVETGPNVTAIGGGVDNGPTEVCLVPVVHPTFKGTVNPNGAKTTYHFEYGGHSTPPKHLEASRGSVNVSETVEVHTSAGPNGGCSPVQFRLIASNAGGTAQGKYSKLIFVTVH